MTPVAVSTVVLVVVTGALVVVDDLLGPGREELRPDAAARSVRVYEFRVEGNAEEALIISPGGPGPARLERPGTRLPWTGRVTVPAGRPAPLMAVSALSRDPRDGWITCSVVRDGVILDERTGTGPRPFANCYGR